MATLAAAKLARSSADSGWPRHAVLAAASVGWSSCGSESEEKEVAEDEEEEEEDDDNDDDDEGGCEAGPDGHAGQYVAVCL
jgi:hypothetical protein